jgi:hypothetical protein
VQSTEQLSLRNIVVHPPSVSDVPPLPLPPHMTPPLEDSGPESFGVEPLELVEPVELLAVPELEPPASMPPELLPLEPPFDASAVPASLEATWLPPHATTTTRSMEGRCNGMACAALCTVPEHAWSAILTGTWPSPYVWHKAVVQLEDAHFPLVLLDLGRAERSPEEVRAIFDGFHTIRRRCIAERVRWILVATAEDMPTAVERKILVDESNKLTRAEHELCVACVAAIPNGFVRGIITLLGWMVPNVRPVAAAPTTDLAVDMAVDRLREVGIEVPLEQAARAADWFHRERSSTRPSA